MSVLRVEVAVNGRTVYDSMLDDPDLDMTESPEIMSRVSVLEGDDG